MADTMTTDAGDAGRLTDVAPPLAVWELDRMRLMHEAGGPASDRHCAYCGYIWPCPESQLLATIDVQSRQLSAYQSVTGVLVRQGLVFINRRREVECIACGEVADSLARIRHMPDCAAEALRALVAGEGEKE